jgi:hypothetical protein
LQGAALAAKPAAKSADFEALRYQLPASKISAKLSLTLEDCGTAPRVSGEVQLAAEADAAPDVFVLRTSQLESARIKRTLNITLHDTGAIATINSATEDRTGAIFGNIVKFLANIAGAVFGVPVGGAASLAPPASRCNDTARAALARVANIERLIGELRSKPGASDPKLASERSKAIDDLAHERAALRVDILHVDVTAPLDLSKLALAPVDPAHPGQRWIATLPVKTKTIAQAWLPSRASPPAMTASWIVTLPEAKAPKIAGAQPADECRHAVTEQSYPAICFVTPIDATFAATLASADLVTKKDGSAISFDADESLPVPQWGTLQYLPLTAGFGSNREMSLTLDKFGRVSEMKWTSQARAETVTAGLAGLAAQASALAGANNHLAEQKSEIEELTTQQQLNKLRACREILAVGGYTCPD